MDAGNVRSFACTACVLDLRDALRVFQLDAIRDFDQRVFYVFRTAGKQISGSRRKIGSKTVQEEARERIGGREHRPAIRPGHPDIRRAAAGCRFERRIEIKTCTAPIGNGFAGLRDACDILSQRFLERSVATDVLNKIVISRQRCGHFARDGRIGAGCNSQGRQICSDCRCDAELSSETPGWTF